MVGPHDGRQAKAPAQVRRLCGLIKPGLSDQQMYRIAVDNAGSVCSTALHYANLSLP